MCGRFAFFSPREAIQAAFGLDFEPPEPRFNVSPGQNVDLIHVDESGQLQVASCRWGLVPFWAKDPAIGNRMINARAETVGEKPAFRQAFARRRCLIMASGFYEWHTDDSGKWPWFISRNNGAAFGMAGLWESWDKGPGDAPLRTCTIITTPADAFMARLHHRMPVMLDQSRMHQWLDAAAPAAELSGMLFDPPAVPLRAWKVSRQVNNPVNESEELIEEVSA